MPRTRVPIPLGAGVDRATGAAVVDARTLAEGRNLIAREASLGLRPGMTGTGLPVYDPAEATNVASDIVCTLSMLSTRDVLQVTYDRSTRKVLVWRLNPNGPTKQFVTTWGTLNANALFPVIVATESYGKMFFAHAEPTVAYRLSTGYYTPNATDATVGSWTTLQADLDSSGAASDVKFYTLCSWGPYLTGAGWGTDAVGDRPEVVRISVGADPTTFKPETYFLCGARGERVEALGAMADGLLCANTTRRHTIYGSSPDDFGARLTDPSFGCTSARALVVVGGNAYAWSAQGPRLIESALTPSVDLAIPLDIFGAIPGDSSTSVDSMWSDIWADIWGDIWAGTSTSTAAPASGPDRLRFAAYDPEARVLYYVAPDPENDATTTFAWVASLRSPGSIRWTDAVFGRCLLSAGVYYTGKVIPPPATGYAASTGAADDGVVVSAKRRVTVTWTNTSNLGDETVELWQKTGSTWAIAATFAVSGIGTTQTRQVTGLDPFTAYSFAVRLATPAGAYPTGFTESTPDAWTSGSAAGAKATVTTSSTAPTIASATWGRVSSTDTAIALSIAITNTGVPVELELDAGSGYSVVDTTAVTVTPYSVSYVIPAPQMGLTLAFRARAKRGASASSYSAVSSVYAGFQSTPPDTTLALDESNLNGSHKQIRVWLAGNEDGADTYDLNEVGQSNSVQCAAVSRTLGSDEPVVETSIASVVAGTSGTFSYRVRSGKTRFGVTDWGSWSSTRTQSCSGSNSTTAQEDDFNFYSTPFSRGDFDLGNTLPRQFTPQELTDPAFQLWFSFYTYGSRYYLLGPVPSSQNTVLTTLTTPPTITFFGCEVFIVDTNLGVRGPSTVIA